MEIVLTDHSALMWLMKMKDPVARLARWAIYLQAFDFEIIHRKGLIHSNADTLSRPVLLAIEEDNQKDKIFLSKMWTHTKTTLYYIILNIESIYQEHICEICRRNEKQATVQHPAKVIKTIFVHCMIGMDLVIGFPETGEGLVGLLVITEYLTKYPYVKPIKSKTANEIAELLWEDITFFGPLKVILSDNGTEFVNSVVERLHA